MKVFYYIMAHKHPEQVALLAKALACSDDRVCIHVDRNVDIDQFKHHIQLNGVYFAVERIRVYWGGFSQVKCIIAGMKEFINSGCDFFVLLSGQDFPIRPVQDFKAFLLNHQLHNLMDFSDIGKEWDSGLSRVRLYYLVDFWQALRHRVPVLRGMLNKTEGLFNFLQQRMLRVSRTFKKRIAGGSGWFTLNRRTVEYVLKTVADERDYIRFFSYTISPDEMFFHTIIANSGMQESVLPGHVFYRFLHSQRNPVVFTSSDATIFNTRPEFFARKFDVSVDKEVLTILYNRNATK